MNLPDTLSLKNHTQKTVETPEPVFVSGSTYVFSAPQAEPGACDLTVTQGTASATTPLEAVAATISWDAADAQPGEVRALRVTLEGASTPEKWLLSGTIDITNGQVVSVADPARISIKGASLTMTDLPGSVVNVAQVRALQTGKMTAVSRLRAVKTPAK